MQAMNWFENPFSQKTQKNVDSSCHNETDNNRVFLAPKLLSHLQENFFKTFYIPIHGSWYRHLLQGEKDAFLKYCRPAW